MLPPITGALMSLDAPEIPHTAVEKIFPTGLGVVLLSETLSYFLTMK